MNLELKRYPEYFDTTPGELWLSDQTRICYTLELPWKNNQDDISCVPLGTYGLIINMSEKFETLLPLLLDVPERDGIRLHAANYKHQLKGCIAPVTTLIIMSKKIFGSSSGDKLEEVMRLIRAHSITQIRISQK